MCHDVRAVLRLVRARGTAGERRHVMSGSETTALRQRYAEDGFCVIPALFPPDLVAEALVAADVAADGETDTGLAPRLRERDAGEEPQRLVKIAEPPAPARCRPAPLC
jgi:hypothetical protein